MIDILRKIINLCSWFVEVEYRFWFNIWLTWLRNIRISLCAISFNKLILNDTFRYTVSFLGHIILIFKNILFFFQRLLVKGKLTWLYKLSKEFHFKIFILIFKMFKIFLQLGIEDSLLFWDSFLQINLYSSNQLFEIICLFWILCFLNMY